MKHRNLVASVLARLKNVAKARNVIFGEILLRYAVECILRRIGKSAYSSQCILKGGALLLVWGDGSSYRPTMDADLELRGDGSPDALADMFLKIAEMPGEEVDGIHIGKKDIKAVLIRDDDEYGGVRVTMTAFLGKVRIPVQFDVGIGDAITPPPKKADFPVLLDGSTPRIKVYPKETVIAEKFETIVKRGLANSRMKDYYDLWMLMMQIWLRAPSSEHSGDEKRTCRIMCPMGCLMNLLRMRSRLFSGMPLSARIAFHWQTVISCQ